MINSSRSMDAVISLDRISNRSQNRVTDVKCKCDSSFTTVLDSVITCLEEKDLVLEVLGIHANRKQEWRQSDMKGG